MSHAYHQIVLDAESRKYVTVNIYKGILTYWFYFLESLLAPPSSNGLRGLQHGAVFLDDILVTGHNDKEHLQTLARALDRLQEAGLQLKRSKCTFMENEVMFLGHKVDETGLHPAPGKVMAIQNAPSPKNVTELKAYLGLLNYYNMFLSNMSTVLAPVHKLLQKDAKWNWGGEQEAAFTQSKKWFSPYKFWFFMTPKSLFILFTGAMHINKHNCKGARISPKGYFSSVDPWQNVKRSP